MTNLTIRTRLTIGIVTITACISALGVLFGISLLEGQIRDAAIDDHAERFVNNDELFGLVELSGGEIDHDAGFIEPLELVNDFAVEFDPTEVETQDLLGFVREYVESLSGLDDAIDVFGSPTGELYVWVGFPQLLAIDGSDARWIDLEELGNTPIVPWDDLFELDTLLRSGVFEEGALEADAAELKLEFGVREIEGQRVGLIAEVSDELDALDAIRATLRSVVIGLTVVAGLLTWVISGRALRPVAALTTQVREISSGTLSDRVPEPSTNDEVGVLARTMNSMLGRLETSDLRRRQFVSDASHELRTPVAVLRSEAEVAHRAPGSTTIDRLASVVLGEAQRLEGLVEDLLSLARSDEAKVLTATAAIDVDEIVLAEVARARSISIDPSAVSAGRVFGHGDDMQRVVAHLLDNASRHGESQVAVGVQTSGRTVTLWVDDDGRGVCEGERERIFERFIRLDDARTRDSGGAGLGLAVVHSTIERMNGSVRVADSPLGGARFQIELPAA